MAWQAVTFECGCDGHLQAYGKSSDRQRKAQWMAGRRLCDECFAKKREEERAAKDIAAVEIAAEYDLPELEGSEKQVAWAMRIRADVIAASEAGRQYMTDSIPRHRAEIAATMDFDETFNGILGATNSRWWIESGQRFLGNPAAFADRMYHEASTNLKESKETVLKPAGESVSVIRLSRVGSDIHISTDRKEADRLIDAIKDIGFHWADIKWTLKVPTAPVPIAHVVAGIAQEIVALGYSVCVDDTEVADLVRSDTVEPDNSRKIVAIGDSHVGIRFRRSEDLYETVSSLPGARWSAPFVKVPASSASEILDLADRLGFFVSQAAQDLLASVDQLVVAGKAVTLGGAAKVTATGLSGGVDASLLDD